MIAAAKARREAFEADENKIVVWRDTQKEFKIRKNSLLAGQPIKIKMNHENPSGNIHIKKEPLGMHFFNSFYGVYIYCLLMYTKSVRFSFPIFCQIALLTGYLLVIYFL